MLYAGLGAPQLNLEYVVAQRPRYPMHDWQELFQRACHHEDDGHMCKLIRAIANAQIVSLPYATDPAFRVQQRHFLPCAHAAIDSGTMQPMKGAAHFDLVRGAGFEKAWEGVPIHIHSRA